MKLGSLFSGYGGLDRAVHAVFPGVETRWVSDIESGPCKILAHRYTDAPNLGDITTIDWADVEPVDIIAGGSPCQDLSTAGKRAGMRTGTRSGLWESMREAIAIIKPAFVVWENVLGALSAGANSDSELEFDKGPLGGGADGCSLRALGRVLGDLSSLGYDAQWTVIRASDVGAPHHRARVFLLGVRQGAVAPSFVEPVVGAVPGSLEMLPTITTQDTDSPAPSQLERNTIPLNTLVTMLPTPDAYEGTRGGSQHPDKKRAGGHQVTLADVTEHAILPTPCAQPSGNTPEEHLRKKPGRTQVTDLAILVENGLLTTGGQLLPTPRATRGGSHTETVQLLETGGLLPPDAVRVFPTPNTMDTLPVREGEAREKALHRGGETSRRESTGNLREEIAHLPTPTAERPDGRKSEAFAKGRATFYDIVKDNKWGKYAAAIHRWEHVLGVPAPEPTVISPSTGRPVLSPMFTEWMMGLPPGWITDVPGITRTEAIRACGNGVVPQQAAAALRGLLQDATLEAPDVA